MLSLRKHATGVSDVFLLAAMAAGLLSGASPAWAVQWQSDGTTLSGDWNETLHWSTGSIPRTNETAVLPDLGTGYTVTIPHSWHLVAGFSIASSSANLHFGRTAEAKLQVRNDVVNAGTISFRPVSAQSSLLLDSGGGVYHTLVNSGTVTLEPGCTPRILGSLNNSGTVNWNENCSIEGANQVYKNTGQWNIAAGKTMGIGSTWGPLGQEFVQEAGNLQNEGILDVYDATFRYTGGTIAGAGTLWFRKGATLELSATGPATFPFVDTGNTIKAETIAAGQTVSVGMSEFGTATSVALGNAAPGADTVTNQGAIILDSSTSAVLSIEHGGSYQTLHNDSGGVLTLESKSVLSFLGSLDNSGTVSCNKSLWLATPGQTYTNRGDMTYASGFSRVMGNNQTFTQAAGTLTINATLEFIASSGDATFVFSGGTIAGSGTLTIATGPLTNESGTVRPGAPVGIFTLNTDYAQGSGGTLEIELGGTGYAQSDKLVVNGALDPGGTLNVTLQDLFVPKAGDVYDILDWATISGSTFDTVNVPDLPEGLSWDASHLYTDGSLAVVVPGATRSGYLECR